MKQIFAVYETDEWYSKSGRERTGVFASRRGKSADAYAEVIRAFKRRLQTYLKRYGMKDIAAWAYVRD